MRSLARETVFKFIFAKFFNPSDEELFAVLLKDEKLTDDDKVFANELLSAVEREKNATLEKIDKLANGYCANRIHRADKCALLIGISEIDNFKNTPVAVAIDEAVKLAARYSTEKGTDFVNGILAEYVKEKRNNGDNN